MSGKLIAFVVALVAVLGLLATAYFHGVSNDKRRSDAVIAHMQADAAQAAQKAQEQHAIDLRAVADAEHAKQQAVAEIDSHYQEVIANEKQNTDATISGLQLGTIRLRKQLAAVPSASSSSAGDVASSASSGNASDSPGLREADAEFLLRIAGEADAAVNQLAACQALVKADRGHAP